MRVWVGAIGQRGRPLCHYGPHRCVILGWPLPEGGFKRSRVSELPTCFPDQKSGKRILTTL